MMVPLPIRKEDEQNRWQVKDDLYDVENCYTSFFSHGGPDMKIAESAIQLYSERFAQERHEKRESLTVWSDSQDRKTIEDNNGTGAELKAEKENAIEQSAQVSLSQEVVRRRPVKAVAQPLSDEDRMMADLNMRILKELVERLTGKKIRLSAPQDVLPQELPNGEPEVVQQAEGEQSAQTGQNQGFGLIYDYYESHYEYEATSFDAEGLIRTEDGQEIAFNLELNMQREFYSEESVNIRMGDALKDPLVINFSGSAAQLTETKFTFDIDFDGTDDQISFVQPGSGFLALDANDDGVVNDGSELFGPASGNGFQELAQFDTDNNNWIDENDGIYSRLRIWTKNSEGEDQLLSLGQKGIGAIYLGHMSSPFALKDADNQLQGQVVSTGVFLQENGGVGSVQQIDLVA